MRENYLEEYYSFLRFPSVSTDDQYKQKLEECARWLVEKLTSIGLETKLVPTRGHPIVCARNKHQPGRRTVLIYGHYDVQPPDPLELWVSPPFEPVLKQRYVFARGATDIKDQILAHIPGIFGGAVANPLTALAQLLATLHDREGRVAIAGFYDRVKPLENWEREAWRKLPVDGDKLILKETGVPELFGEGGYNSLELIWA